MNKTIFLLLSCVIAQNSVSAMERKTVAKKQKTVTKINLLIKDIKKWVNDIKDIEKLLSTGMDVNLPGRENFTPLFVAIENDKVEIAKILLAHGANPNLKNGKWFGRTALHLAASIGNANMVKFLVGNGANIDEQDIDGNTPLHLAVLGRNPEVVQLLVNNGANSDQRNGNGESPLTWTINLYYKEISQIIRNHKKKTAILHGGHHDANSPINLLPDDEELLKYILFNI